MAVRAPSFSLRGAALVLLALLALGIVQQTRSRPEAARSPEGGGELAAQSNHTTAPCFWSWRPPTPPFTFFCRSAWLALADAALKDGVRVALLYGSGALSAEEESPFDFVVDFIDATEVWSPSPAQLQIINKTLLALPILSERFSFDFMVRTNIHTFWDTRRLT